MSGIVVAFTSLASVAALGYLAGVAGVLRAQDEVVLSRLAFFVAAPALLFTTIATADLSRILSPVLVTAVVSVAVAQAIFVLVARGLWRRPRSEVTIGALASSYVNSGNLGIPISVYVLGDGALVAPILLFQLLVLAPGAFLVLDAGGDGGRDVPGRSAWRMLWGVLRRPLRNPITVASLLGLAAALAGIELPEPIMQPISLVGAAAVPVALLAYGLGLSGARRGARPDDAGETTGRKDVALAVLLKCFVQPVAAYLTGLLLGLDGTMLFAATLFAALPTAQNIYVFASHYRTGRRLARTTLMVTTGLSIPIMAVVSALLG